MNNEHMKGNIAALYAANNNAYKEILQNMANIKEVLRTIIIPAKVMMNNIQG